MNEQTILQSEERPSGLKVIHIQGDLDSMGTHMVQDKFDDELAEHESHVVVDMGRVGFISSAGMAMLLVKGKRLRQVGGKLTIAGASARVHEVLSLAGFHELFEVYPTLDNALESLETASKG